MLLTITPTDIALISILTIMYLSLIWGIFNKYKYFKPILFILSLFPLGLIGLQLGLINFMLNLPILIFTFSAFIAGFLVDRTYIYISAIIFLVCAAIVNTLGFSEIAELMAVICYLFLVLGVFRDVFYEKIFDAN